MPTLQNNPNNQNPYYIVTNMLWRDIEPILLQLNPNPVTKNEMAFGLVTTEYNYGIILRNWYVN